MVLLAGKEAKVRRTWTLVVEREHWTLLAPVAGVHVGEDGTLMEVGNVMSK